MSHNEKSNSLTDGLDARVLAVPAAQGKSNDGGYCFVKKRTQPIVAATATADPIAVPDAAQVDTMFKKLTGDLDVQATAASAEDAACVLSVTDDLADAAEFEQGQVTEPVATVTTVTAVRYHLDAFCGCARMMDAMALDVMVIIPDGPVTFPDPYGREMTMTPSTVEATDSALAGHYDGSEWAFRFCPFEDGQVVIDELVPATTQDMRTVDDVRGCTCCSKMDDAVRLAQVELSERKATLPKFVAPESPTSLYFNVCPWCGTSMIDLSVKRHIEQMSRPEEPVAVAVPARTKTLPGICCPPSPIL